MKYGATMLVGIICGIALTGQGRPTPDDAAPQPAEAGGEPYGAIWLRNVFDLKPAPPPQTNVVDEKPPEPPPNVKLTGITTIFGKKLALFMVQPTPERGKPPEKEISYMLTEGERRGPLEVVAIMPKDRKVTIKVDDTVSTITFPTNSPSGAGGPPGAHAGGPPFTPPPGMSPPGFTPPGMPRPMRQGGYGGTPPPHANNYSPNNYSPSSYAGGSAQGGVLQGGYTPPASTTSGGGTGLGGSAFTAPAPQLLAPAVTPALTAEQQQVAIAAQYAAHMQSGDTESASILPPIPGLTDGSNSGLQNSTTEPAAPTPVQQTPFGQRTTGTYNR